MGRRGDGFDTFGKPPVMRIVYKRADVDMILAGEVIQDIPGPDLVALVGRIRDAMYEEK